MSLLRSGLCKGCSDWCQKNSSLLSPSKAYLMSPIYKEEKEPYSTVMSPYSLEGIPLNQGDFTRNLKHYIDYFLTQNLQVLRTVYTSYFLLQVISCIAEDFAGTLHILPLYNPRVWLKHDFASIQCDHRIGFVNHVSIGNVQRPPHIPHMISILEPRCNMVIAQYWKKLSSCTTVQNPLWYKT